MIVKSLQLISETILSLSPTSSAGHKTEGFYCDEHRKSKLNHSIQHKVIPDLQRRWLISDFSGGWHTPIFAGVAGRSG